MDGVAGGPIDGSLSRLVHLRHFVVQHTRDSRSLSVATLPRLQHLTSLQVGSLSIENLLQLGGFTKLQELFFCR